jgi:hypothetical protein
MRGRVEMHPHTGSSRHFTVGVLLGIGIAIVFSSSIPIPTPIPTRATRAADRVHPQAEGKLKPRTDLRTF